MMDENMQITLTVAGDACPFWIGGIDTFLFENADSLDRQEVDAITMAIGRNETYTLGGGAAPEIEISAVS